MSEAAFLDAIRREPEDDTHRLVFADWLTDNGQPERAQFIRLHIAWCQRPTDAPPDDDLKARLLAAFAATWLADRGQLYDRGFTSVGWFEDFDGFADLADRVFGEHPIRVVYLYQDFTYEEDRRPFERFRAAAGLLRGVIGLGCMSRGWPQDYVRDVLSLPELADLQMLDFADSDEFGPKVAHAIAAANHLTNLRVLDLSGCGIEDEGLEALAGASHLGSLTSLRLGVHGGNADKDNYLSEDGIAALTRSRYLTNLTQLSVSCNEFGDEGLAHLLKWKHLGNLTELDLSVTGVSDDGLLALTRSRKLDNLRRLDVRNGNLMSEVARAFLRAPGLRGLRDLRLSWDAAGDGLPPDLVRELVDRFGPAVASETPFPLSCVCEADRICARARRIDPYGKQPELRVL
jgi:uncharacterized protein (TIGR02996 family)